MRLSNIRNTLYLCIGFLLLSAAGNAQKWKSYTMGNKGDTLNRLDQNGREQGPWIIRQEALRGEPGFEEEGVFVDGMRMGVWRRYTIDGDLLAVETFRWGMKDGKSVYFSLDGKPTREESWRAIDPKSPYDTIPVRDLKDPNKIVGHQVVKVEPTPRRHGIWKYYDERTGRLDHKEEWVLDKLKSENGEELEPIIPTAGAAQAPAQEAPPPVRSRREVDLATRPAYEKKEKVDKPPVVVGFEKKHAGKKKVKVVDGSASAN